MRRLVRAVDRHFFAPGSLRDLALARIVAFGAQTLFFLILPVASLRSVTEQVQWSVTAAPPYQPLPVLRAFLLPWGVETVQPTPAMLAAVVAVAFVAGVCATVGLFARVAMPLAALANLFLTAHWYSYGDFHHGEAIMMIALPVLALGPSGAAWSVDAWRRRRAGRPARPDADPLARWPLQLVQWVMALTYFSAAWAKVVGGGWTWFNGLTMTGHYISLGMTGERDAAVDMALLPPALHVAPSIAAFLFELTFFVAVLVPRAAWVYVLAGVGFHLAVFATMRIGFFQTIVLYVVFAESLRRFGPHALWRARAPQREDAVPARA